MIKTSDIDGGWRGALSGFGQAMMSAPQDAPIGTQLAYGAAGAVKGYKKKDDEADTDSPEDAVKKRVMDLSRQYQSYQS